MQFNNIKKLFKDLWYHLDDVVGDLDPRHDIGVRDRAVSDHDASVAVDRPVIIDDVVVHDEQFLVILKRYFFLQFFNLL